MIFTACFILNVTTINAQEKCSYDVNKADPMTGKQHRVINIPIKLMGILQTVGAWGIQLERLGDDFSITSRLVLGTNVIDNLEKGDSLILKIESGKIITVYAKNRVAPKPLNQPNESPSTLFESVYPITAADFKLMSLGKVLFVRSNVSSHVYDHEIKDKAAIKLQKAAVCILL